MQRMSQCSHVQLVGGLGAARKDNRKQAVCLARCFVLAATVTMLATSCRDHPSAEPSGAKSELTLATVSNLIQRGMSYQVLTQRLGAPVGLQAIAPDEQAMLFEFSEATLSKDATEAAIGVFVSTADNQVDEFMVIWQPIAGGVTGRRGPLKALPDGELLTSTPQKAQLKIFVLHDTSGDGRRRVSDPAIQGDWFVSGEPELMAGQCLVEIQMNGAAPTAGMSALIKLTEETSQRFSDLVSDENGKNAAIMIDGNYIGTGNLLAPIGSGKMVVRLAEQLSLQASEWLKGAIAEK